MPHDSALPCGLLLHSCRWLSMTEPKRHLIKLTAWPPPCPAVVCSGGEQQLKTNFESEHPSSWFAKLYADDALTGGHVIMLGADEASKAAAFGALAAYPGGLQLGGGVTADNAVQYLEAGASHVIVTSYVFREGRLEEGRLADLVRPCLLHACTARTLLLSSWLACTERTAGITTTSRAAASQCCNELHLMQMSLHLQVKLVGKQRLVLDLSCRKKDDGKYYVVTDRWQKFSTLALR